MRSRIVWYDNINNRKVVLVLRSQSFENRTAIITGASGGIGAEIAFAFAKKGGLPILLGRSPSKLRHTQQQIMQSTSITPPIYPVDLTNEGAVHATFDAILASYPTIDTLINNAGQGDFTTFHDTSMTTIKRMFDVNVFGLMMCTKRVVPHMIRQQHGHIVNIASLAGKVATPKAGAYAASKHAVIGFSNSLRMELQDEGIAVTTVNPGPVRTAFLNEDYAKAVKRWSLPPEKVAERVIDALFTTQREINMPRTIAIGSVLYHIIPGLAEKMAAPLFKKK